MDGKGRWADNIVVERLWRNVKYEEVYTKEYSSVGELTKALKSYFSFYSNERRHLGIDEKTPAEIYLVEQDAQPLLAVWKRTWQGVCKAGKVGKYDGNLYLKLMRSLSLTWGPL